MRFARIVLLISRFRNADEEEGTNDDYVCLLKLSNMYEGWTNCLSDYTVFKKALGDNLHFAVAKTRHGDFVGSCMSLLFDDMAFVGLYFVLPQYRGRQIGTTLFNSVMTQPVSNSNVGLHAALKMSPTYDRILGFSHYSGWTTDIVQISNIQLDKIKCANDIFKVENAYETAFSESFAYERSISKTSREKFFQITSVFREDAICKVVFTEAGEIVGFGRARLSLIGSLILGPLYCDNDDSFVVLFKSLIGSYPDSVWKSTNTLMRSPSAKTSRIRQLLSGAVEITEVSRLQPQFTKFVPEHDISRIYAITDLTVFV